MTTKYGEIKTAAVAGATSLVLKALGTGTINKYTRLKIIGDTTEYTIINTATINETKNEATVNIHPALVVDVPVDIAVQLYVHESTLTPELEDLLADWVAGQVAINHSNVTYQQTQTAITTIGTTSTLLSTMSARMIQALEDIALGRVESVKISALIDLAHTKIGDMTARLTQATTDVADGRVETVKITALLDESRTLLNTVEDEIEKATDARDTAITDVDKVSRIFQEYIQLSTIALNNANAILNNASGFISEGQAREGNAGAYNQQMAAQISLANADLNQAIGYIRDGQAREGNSDALLKQATAQMSTINNILNQSNGHFREVTSRLSVATSGGILESWGRRKVLETEKRLKQLIRPRTSCQYSR
jgi:hypothetical protein